MMAKNNDINVGELMVRFRMKCQLKIAPSFAEDKPCVCVYLPSSFKRDVANVYPDRLDPSKEFEVELRGFHPPGPLRLDTCVNMHMYATSRNKHGEPCDTDAGVTQFNVADMLEMATRQKDGVCEIIKPFTMHTAQEFSKGTACIRFSSLDIVLGPGLYWEETPQNSENLLCNTKRCVQDLETYVAQCSRIEKMLKPTFAGTERIRCPRDWSEERFEGAVGIPLPASAYAMYEIPSSTPEFWENLLTNVMLREGITRCDWKHLSQENRARLLGLMVSAIPASMPYRSDDINLNRAAKPGDAELYTRRLVQPIECFGDALRTLSGDCEDLGCAIAAIVTAFTVGKRPEDQVLSQLYDIASGYIDFQTLDGVAGAQVADTTTPSGIRIRRQGAHMNSTMISMARVEDMLRRGACAKNVYKESAEAAITAANVISKHRCSWMENLPALACEGTGLFDPCAQGCDPCANMKSRVFRDCKPLEVAKKMIQHPRFDPKTKKPLEDPFFKTVQKGLSRWWMDNANLPVMDFWFGYLDNAGCVHRGVRYSDILCDFTDDAQNVVLIAAPIMCLEAVSALRSVSKNRPPPRMLQFPVPVQSLIKTPEIHPGLERIGCLLRKTRCIERGKKICWVKSYVRPHVLTDNWLRKLECWLVGSKYVVDLCHRREVWTSSFVTYEISLGVYQ